MNEEVVYQVDAKRYRATLFENRFRIELVNAWNTVINTREYYLNHVLSVEHRKSKEVRIRFGQGWNYADIAFKKTDDADLFTYFMNALF